MDNYLSDTHKRKVWLAIILHILTVGLGHSYNGKLRRGFTVFILLQSSSVLFLILATVFENFNYFILASVIPLIIWFVGLIDTILITKSNSMNYVPKLYNRWYYYLLIAVIFFGISEVLNRWSESYTGDIRIVKGASMQNALFTGDVVFYKKLGINSIKNNDVIAIDVDGPGYKGMVKRCIASDGQTVEIINGKVCVDGKLNLPPPISQLPGLVNVNVDFSQDSLLRDFNMAPTVIPTDCIFVMGDNRYNSRDSRSFGPINKSKVIGKVIFVVFSTGANLDKSTGLIDRAVEIITKTRWNRIGLRIR
jgi:signal peptidase I